MPNELKYAEGKPTAPVERQNAQGDHEGSEDAPDDFDVMNPQKQALDDKKADRRTPKSPVSR